MVRRARDAPGGPIYLCARSGIQIRDVTDVTITKTKTRRGVQVAAARARATAPLVPGSIRLLDRHEVCALAGCTYPTIWKMMREGRFPRSRACGGKAVWLSSEIEAWLAALPVRPLKGDGRAVDAVTLAAGGRS
jgi:predicted DNA-binding transcriptional regulator AlpA